ncbi:restriction endonuclease subunit S [Nonlabens sp.]|uniref:restriction endonuclease subunit S n=1 Tax=Nonlabens sp. TaxID=1888209 RepID=UPI0032662842
MNNSTQQPRIPQLRFPAFDGEWEEKRLESVFSEFKSGNNITSDDISEHGKYPVYGGNGLRGYTSDFTHDGFYLLIGRQGALCGNVNRSNGKSYISEHAIAGKANKTSDTEWLAQRLDYFKLNRLSESSAQPGLSVGKLLRYKLKFPSLQEQQKIATFLTAVDDKITKLTSKKEQLTQYKKGVMQQLFSQELRFQDENGNDFADWEAKRLGKLTYKVGKKNKENIKHPIYSINNQEGFLPQSEQFDGLNSNDRGYDISLYKIVESETFAYNPARINVGSIGYSNDLKKVIVSSLYVCFKTNHELDDQFLLSYLETYNFQKDILRFQEGGVRQYLFYENFSMIKVPIPSLKEQQKIASYLSALDDKIEAVQVQIEKTQEFKKGLLQQLFV